MKHFSEKDFTYDWSLPYKRNLRNVMRGRIGTPMNYLELGVFEGRSMYIIREKFFTHPDCNLYGIDRWSVEEMSERHFPKGEEGRKRMQMVEARAKRNLSTYINVTLIKDCSHEYLKAGNFENDFFDLIYVDASHHCYDALLDSMLAWPLLRVGGIMVWDDYKWNRKITVRQAVDVFLAAVDGDYEPLFENRQKGVRKLREPKSQKRFRRE